MNKQPKKPTPKVTKNKSKSAVLVAYTKKLWISSSKIARLLFVFAAMGIVLLITMRIMAASYQRSQSSNDFEFGITYVSRYAESFGLNARATYSKMLNELPVDNVRLVSYWDELEVIEDELAFDELDWQFDEAQKRDVQVSLAIGLRQPRYPECHEPEWAAQKRQVDRFAWEADLTDFISKVVERYKDRPNLKSYQLENEFLLEEFGQCPDFSRDRVARELDLVKRIDSDTPIIMSRSNNYGGFALGEPQPDIVGISVYRKVHNKSLGYVTYPLPPWYYAFLSQGQKTIGGQESIIHEFQLEPWIANGELSDATIDEQNKTMSAEQVKKNIDFARRTGIKEVYFWGAEWWFARDAQGDSSILDSVKEALNQ